MLESPIDWQSSQSHVCVDTSHPDDSAPSLSQLPDFDSHLWLQTSGSTGGPKWVGLSKSAFLSSALSVNRHLEVQLQEIWLNPLPTHHVGGLSIFARAHLGGQQVIQLKGFKWNPKKFFEALGDHRINLCSLVPTQIYDLVKNSLKSPPHLRVVLVGGGSLSESLFERAKALGWPILPTYGMTECCSQVATASLASLDQSDFPQLDLLSHLQARVRKDQRLQLLGPSLLTGYWSEKVGCVDPKDSKGWFTTADCAEIRDNHLMFKGRADQVRKISGELVSLWTVSDRLTKLIEDRDEDFEIAVVFVPDQRRQNRLSLVVTHSDFPSATNLADFWNRSCVGYERLSEVYGIDRLPKTQLGKLNQIQLLNQLGL